MASVPPQGPAAEQPAHGHAAPFLFQQMALFSLLGPSFGSPEMMRRLLFSQDMPSQNYASISTTSRRNRKWCRWT